MRNVKKGSVSLEAGLQETNTKTNTLFKPVGLATKKLSKTEAN